MKKPLIASLILLSSTLFLFGCGAKNPDTPTVNIESIPESVSKEESSEEIDESNYSIKKPTIVLWVSTLLM